MKNWRSYIHAIRKLLTGKFPYSRFAVLTTYLSLLIRSFLLSKIGIRKDIYEVRLLNFNIAFRNHAEMAQMLEEIFIDQVYFFEATQVQPIIIDAGSNIGISVLYFKTLYPACTVIAFEPDPKNFAALVLNIERNRINDITIHPYALGAAGEQVTLTTDSQRTINSKISEHASSQTEIVEQVRLSDFVNAGIDFLKMDIEGMEEVVIKDLIDSGKLALVNAMTIEHHESGRGNNYDNFASVIERNGFKILSIQPQAPNADRIVTCLRK